jgi:hypothetical protein
MAWEGLSNEMGVVKSMHVEMEPRIIRMSRELSGIFRFQPFLICPGYLYQWTGKVPAVVLGIKLEQNILDGTGKRQFHSLV